MNARMLVAGRALALASATVSTLTWSWLVFFSPLTEGTEALPPAWVAAALFVGIAWAGVGGAFRDAPLVTGLVGFISLVPVGVYFLIAPWPLRLLGVAPLLMIAAAVLVLKAPASAPEDQANSAG